MGQPSSKDEMTIRHQFDRLCQMALKGEAVNYYKHMDYRRKHEVAFSELSEKELSKLFTMDEYGTEYHHFEGTYRKKKECYFTFVFYGNERCGYCKRNESGSQYHS